MESRGAHQVRMKMMGFEFMVITKAGCSTEKNAKRIMVKCSTLPVQDSKHYLVGERE